MGTRLSVAEKRKTPRSHDDIRAPNKNRQPRTFYKIQQIFNSSLETLKMLVVLASLVALFLAPAASQETTVKVGFYGEALCPDCINFINGPLTHAFKEVSWCSALYHACRLINLLLYTAFNTDIAHAGSDVAYATYFALGKMHSPQQI
jgi:hypothetical protein